MSLSARRALPAAAAAILALLWVAAPARADVLELADGLCLEGKILKEDASSVTLLTRAGRKEVVPRRKIARVNRGLSLYDLYLSRLAGAKAKDGRADLELGLWCEKQKMAGLAARHFLRAVEADPLLEEARLKLGHLKEGGAWFENLAAARRAQGKTFFRGEWLDRDALAGRSKDFLESHGDWFTKAEEARLAAGDAVAVGDAGDGWFTVRSRHYRFRTRLRESKALMFARIAEQAYAAFERHFGFKPEGLLRGDVFGDLASFEDFTVSLGLCEPGRLRAHGFYEGYLGRIFFPYIDDDYTSRNILIHELCHQFEMQARPGARVPAWYFEGLACVFSHHSNDDWKLETAILAPKTNINLYYLQHLIETGEVRGLREILEGGPGAEVDPVFYHHAWGLAWFLMKCGEGGYAEKFRAFEADLHGSECAAEDRTELFVRHFGPLPEVEAAFLAFLKTQKGVKWRGEGVPAGSGRK